MSPNIFRVTTRPRGYWFDRALDLIDRNPIRSLAIVVAIVAVLLAMLVLF